MVEQGSEQEDSWLNQSRRQTVQQPIFYLSQERLIEMNQTNLLLELQNTLLSYTSLLNSFEKRKPLYPSGNLIVRKLKDNTYYYRSVKHHGRWIQIPIPLTTNDGKRFISALIEKRVVLNGIKVLRKNIKAIQNMLCSYESYDPETLIPESYRPEMIENGMFLSDDLFVPGQLNIGRWITDTRNRNYQTNPWYPERLIFETESGHLVRSKSEMEIDNHLYRLNLIYRYESELRLPIGKTIYPDFTVLHPTEKRLVFIEHFGLMDNPDYVMDKILTRLMDYAKCGYILGRDVFFTMESSARPLLKRQIIGMLKESGLMR